jgi:hypothetical protein
MASTPHSSAGEASYSEHRTYPFPQLPRSCALDIDIDDVLPELD